MKLLLATVTLFVGLILASSGGVTLAQSPAAITAVDCNSTAFSQIANDPTKLVGRRLLPSGACSNSNWTIALYDINWSTGQTAHVRDLIQMPAITSQGEQITTAYDPSVIQVNGETLVAFECGSSTVPPSVCMATLDPPYYLVNTGRLNVIVRGVPGSTTIDHKSASVPKLFTFNNQPYLYWTMVRELNSVDTGIDPRDLYFGTLVTRGASITREASYPNRFWVTGSTGVSLPTDSGLSYEVLGPDPNDPLSDSVADTFDVRQVNGQLWMTVGVGGTACTNPKSVAFGCYRLQIRTATAPLGHHIYNASVATNPILPFNPHEYSRFITTGATGNVEIMGNYFKGTPDPLLNETAGSAWPLGALPLGLSRTDYGSPSNFSFSTTVVTPAPSPKYSAMSLPLRYDSLKRFVSSCSWYNPFPNQADASCFAAASRYCASQGYTGGGFLHSFLSPSSGSPAVAGVSCLKNNAHAQRSQVSIAAVSAYGSSCTMSNLVSDVCASAMASYCVANGYGSGGFGPLEAANGHVQLVCMTGGIATVQATTFTTLQQYHGECTSSNPSASIGCYAAVHAYCSSISGHESGYGVLYHLSNNVSVGCLRKAIAG